MTVWTMGPTTTKVEVQQMDSHEEEQPSSFDEKIHQKKRTRKRITQIIKEANQNENSFIDETTNLLGLEELREITTVLLTKEESAVDSKSKEEGNLAVEGIPVVVLPNQPKEDNEAPVVIFPMPEPPEIIVPPIAPISVPVLQLSTNQLTIHEGQVFNPWDYISVYDELDSQVQVEVYGEALRLGMNTITYVARNKFGYSDQKQLSVFLNSRPKLLHSSDEIELSIHESSDLLLGVSASDDEDGDLTRNIRVYSNVDYTKSGDYWVRYSVRDFHGAWAQPLQKRVRVINHAPVIHGENLIFEIDQPVNLLDYFSVSDFEDDRDGYPISLTEENILATDFDCAKEGTYFITIGNIFDRDDKPTEEKTFTIEVQNEAPEISVEEVQLIVNESLDIEKLKAAIQITDREDDKKGLEVPFTIDTSQVDVTTVGVYPLVITATDSHGKSSEKMIYVTVLPESEEIEDEAEDESEELEEEEVMADA
ncbi:hypothetical protein BH739_04625 [Enterococcus casseliflavus]|nr:hypothetical protein BH739_04625 [Enterococcus casseliflavus]